MTELIVAGVAILLSLVFFYQARHDRRQGDAARTRLGRAYEEIERLTDKQQRSLKPLPTDSEFRDRLERMQKHDDS